MERILKINAPSVVAEIIDGEAVIMDLASGHYFSSQHVGCEIWRSLEHGSPRAGIVHRVLALYDAPESDVASAVDAYVADLIERKLVVEVDASPSASSNGVTEPHTERRNDFAPPVLHAYTDMEDLLLLDPIHDVDEAGWPMPKPADG
ncbi:MAG TPA: PqqD family protein [Gemmatimonadaceae bacterium]|nr:PqqD family protein [Gemmatimonadaceae bacterium]